MNKHEHNPETSDPSQPNLSLLSGDPELRTLELFDQFRSSYDGGEAPSTNSFLDAAGEESGALFQLIDRYMLSVPARELTPEALERALNDPAFINRFKDPK